MRLSWDGLVIGAECATPAPLSWLREFCAGPFAFPPPHAPAARTARLRLDPARYAELAAASPEEPRLVECFTRDGAFRRLPAWPDPAGLVVLDGAARVAQVVEGDGVTVVAEEDHFHARLALARAVREMATTHALARGRLHLHAAAATVGDDVVAFAGPRRSGKSTLLLHALLAGGARFVTNDRLFVDVDAAPPAARGMPTLVQLREDALAHFAGLDARLRVRGYDRRWTLDEVAAGAAPERWPPSLTPAQVCALTGAGAAGAGPLAAVAFPEVRAEPGHALRPLAPDEAAARLGRSLLLAGLPERPAEAYRGPDPAPPRDGAALAALCRALTARVPACVVELGPGAYEGAAPVWGALLAWLRG